jgi:AAA family ATP:ADP antiporter
MGRFYAVVNTAGLLIQLFLVSRVVKYLGVAVGLMILPVIALGAYSLIAFYPVLSLIRWAKTAENSTDYSLNNTVRAMLFLPTTREQKYKAKQVVDSFFWRVGDTGSALLVFVGTTMLAMSLDMFAKVNLVAVLVWLVLAYLIGKEYKRLVATGETPRMEVAEPAGTVERPG